MLSPQKIIDTYYLESRCDLLEIAAMFDRYDAAVERTGEVATDDKKLECLRQAMAVIADPNVSGDRAEKLLNLFATV